MIIIAMQKGQIQGEEEGKTDIILIIMMNLNLKNK